jgi:hypothetical protein
VEVEAADGIDIRSYYADESTDGGLTIEVRGSGLGYFGESRCVSVGDGASAAVDIRVPVGVQFVPDDPQVQTMIGAEAR